MFAPDTEERTQEPTPNRREEARERGHAARSRDLAVSLSLLGGFTALGLLGPGIATRADAMMTGFLRRVSSAPEALSLERLDLLAAEAGAFLLAVTLPVAGAVTAIAVAAGVVQGGFAVHMHAVLPDPARLSPVAGAARLFSARSAVRGLLAVLKFALVGWVSVSALRSLLARGGLAPGEESGGRSGLGACLDQVTSGLGVWLALGLTAVAALDYGLERRLFEGSLRMTPLEVREESHRLEGDPQLKERRRRLSLRLMRRLREKRKQWQS